VLKSGSSDEDFFEIFNPDPQGDELKIED
jgi:hypothetical protein